MTTEQIAGGSIDEFRAQVTRDYDPYSGNTIAEQLADLADRRERCPVSYSTLGKGFWVLTRYDDVSSVLRKSGRGVVSHPNDPLGENSNGAQNKLIPIELDGAEHRAFRTMLDPAFSPARVAELEEGLVKAANDLIDQFIEDGHCDFIDGFALPFPGATVMLIMGWPLEDLPQLYRWADAIMHPRMDLSPEDALAARGAAHVALREYLLDLITRRRTEHAEGNVRDDVTSRAIEAEVDGARLTDDQLFDIFMLMVLAGLDTVQSVLAQSMVHFADHPEKWAEMFAEPGNLEAAVEELVRWSAPPVPTRTITAEKLSVGGVDLPEGERVHFALAAANRDPKYYPNPDEIDFHRDAKPHLGFGLGAHRCLGVHLARLELKIGFTELHRRIPRFELDLSHPLTEQLGLAWGVAGVHLTFSPGPRENS